MARAWPLSPFMGSRAGGSLSQGSGNKCLLCICSPKRISYSESRRSGWTKLHFESKVFLQRTDICEVCSFLTQWVLKAAVCPCLLGAGTQAAWLHPAGALPQRLGEGAGTNGPPLSFLAWARAT